MVNKAEVVDDQQLMVRNVALFGDGVELLAPFEGPAEASQVPAFSALVARTSPDVLSNFDMLEIMPVPQPSELGVEQDLVSDQSLLSDTSEPPALSEDPVPEIDVTEPFSLSAPDETQTATPMLSSNRLTIPPYQRLYAYIAQHDVSSQSPVSPDARQSVALAKSADQREQLDVPDEPVVETITALDETPADVDNGVSVSNEATVPFIAPAEAEDVINDFLTLPQAVEETLLRDPEIAIEESRVKQAIHDVDVATGALRPRVDLQGSAGPRYGDTRDDEQTRTLAREGLLTLRQKLYDGDRSQNTRSTREFQRDAAREAKRGTIESVTLAVTLAYLGLLEAEELYVLAIENQKEHERLLELVRASVEQGFSTKADLSRVEARLAEARSLVFDQLSARDQASQLLEKLIGRKPVQLAAPSMPTAKLPQDLDEALERLVSGNPELARLEAERVAAKRELAAQFGKYVPNIDIVLQGSMNNDATGNTGVGGELTGMFAMNYNLYAGGADKARERMLEERVRETGFAYDQEFRDRKQSVSDQFTALSASRQKSANLEEGVAASVSVSRLYLEQFKAGRRTVFELLDSQVDLYGAKRDRLTNQFEELKRSYQILNDIGRLRSAIID